jgi:hypothetical protein
MQAKDIDQQLATIAARLLLLQLHLDELLLAKR